MEPNQNLGDLLNSYSGSVPTRKPPQDGLGLGSLLNETAAREQEARLRPAAAAPIDDATISAVATQEGLSESQARVMTALLEQESGRGRNAATSVNGARGPGQIIPDTFKRYAKPGERIDDPGHNLAVMARIVKDLGTKFGDDPAKIATGYFSGDGNVNPGQGPAWKNDAADGNGKRVSSYVQDVVGRVGAVPTKAQGPALPNLDQAPKWADIEAKPEYKALDDATKAQTKAAYFDYWIAPSAGAQTAQLREQFLAPPKAPGLMDRLGQAVNEIRNPTIPPQSVTERALREMSAPVTPSENDTSGIPLRPETRRAFNGLWDGASPEKRQELASRPGWVGMLARERLEQNQRLDASIAAVQPQTQTDILGKTTTPEPTSLQRTQDQITRGLDTRVEAREARLRAKGYPPETARRFAEEAAQAGVIPGKEEEYIQYRSGSIKGSDFDFETKALFDPKGERNGLNNEIVRGVVKGGLGIAKTATGWGEFLSDVYGFKGAGDAARSASNAIRGKEAALGEGGDFVARNFEGAINSISQQLPLLIGGVKTGSQVIPLAGMALQTFSQEYSDGRERGQTVGEATTRASIFAAFEVIGEKFGLSEQMAALKGAARGMPSDQIIDFFWRALKKEVPGELLTTTGQFATDKFMPKGIGLNPNATFNDYVKQVADTIAQTLMQGGVMAGGTTGVSKGVQFLREGDTTSPEAQLAKAIQDEVDSRDFTQEGIREDVLRSMNPNGVIMVPPSDGGVGARTMPDGRVEPTINTRNLPTDGEEPPASPAGTAPAAPPAVPPVNRAPGADREEGYTDQDVRDWAEQRASYLWSKREGTLDDNVDPFSGEPVGAGLTPGEQEELNNLERAGDDVAALRQLYGFQPPTQENEDVQNQTPAAPNGTAPGQAPDAQGTGQVPEQRGQQPDETQGAGQGQVDPLRQRLQAVIDRYNAEGMTEQARVVGLSPASKNPTEETVAFQEQLAQRLINERKILQGAEAGSLTPVEPVLRTADMLWQGQSELRSADVVPASIVDLVLAKANEFVTEAARRGVQLDGITTAFPQDYQKLKSDENGLRGTFLRYANQLKAIELDYKKANTESFLKTERELAGLLGVDPKALKDARAAGGRTKADEAAPVAAPAPAPALPAPTAPAVDLSQNTTFKADAVAAARERMKAKLAAQNKPDAPKMMAQDGALDPEMMQDGITLAGAYIEAGVKGYAELEAALVADLGEAIKPFVRTFYEAVRYYPGFNNAGMTPAAEIDAGAAPSPAPAPKVEEPSTPVAAPADLFAPEGKMKVAREIADFFIGGGSFATIVEARKKISELIGRPVEPATELAKQADETIEVAVVLAAREMIEAGRKQGRTPKVIYDRLVSLYNAQPNLAVRSSTSVRDQAYSTPVPLAYLASELAGITYDTKVLEPTAGNGMLVIGAKTGNVTANELNPKRTAMLQAMGIQASTGNAATESLANGKSQDVVIANPPFGATKDADGNTIVYEVTPSYGTREVDHAIAFNALATMKDDGTAVLIVGGVQAESEDGRRDGYRGKGKREFYFNLYQQYNVTDHFTVDGALYSRQGASYPVDVIVIKGRGKATRDLPAADLPVIVRSYDELKEKLNGTRSVDSQGDRGAAGTDRGEAPAGQGDGTPVVGSPGGQGDRTGDQGGARGDAAGVPDGGRAGDGRADGGGTVSGAGQSEPAVTPGRSDGRPAVPADGQGERGSEPAAQGNRPSDVGGPSTVDGQRVESGLSDRRGQETETATQVEYVPSSTASSVGTLVPVAMRDAIQASLARLQDTVGDLDQYVATALAMDPDTLRTNFSAEQVDALALAIANAEDGRGFIIGDQTGIGKGRVVAGMIRYALVKGKIPIFVTEKPNLYADMIRDLDDIGMSGELGLEAARSRILMTNSSESVPYVLLRNVDGEITEQKLTLRPPAAGPALNQMFKDMMQAGNLGEFKVIFTTYSQLQTVAGKVTDRMRFVQQFGAGQYMIFDESHNAGGAGEQQARSKDQREKAKAGESLVTGRASFVRNLVRNAYGTFFSSATYAKRPDVMDLYSSTNMKLAVDKLSQLAEAIKNGGVPMQQVVANMLTTDGQYIRRERTFAGVSYETTETEVNKETAENMASAMRSILSFSRAKEAAIKAIQKEMDKEGSMVGEIAGEKTTVQGSNFGSIMHNLIDQMLLALKAPQAVQHAIERAKAGEKVVLTVSNTMGSFLKDYAEEMGLANGDPVALSFKDLYLRYLEKQRMISIKRPGSKIAEKRRLTDEELGPQLVKMFDDIRTQIENSGFGEAPVSPIDYMHAELRKAGLKTDEITGRTATVNYEGGTPKLASRNANIRQRLAAISGFNNGDVDILILNQSGSTGLSLHASAKFKDQRKRHMVIVQAEKNIDTHMQMLGRVHRTGQVIAPAYSQMMADIPAEMRPAAVLMKKMASLNANTTASRKSSVTAEGVVDFMNDYGGQIVYEFLQDNRDVLEAVGGNKVMGLPDDAEKADEDLIRKFTGYIPILPIEQQDRIYKDLIDRYNDLIERENSLGTNKLEAKAVDLDAETLTSTPVTQAKDDPSIFAQPANMERVEVKRTVKPYSSEEVQKLVADRLNGETGKAVNSAMLANMRSKADGYIERVIADMTERKADPVKISAQRDLLTAVKNHAITVLENYPIGTTISLKDKIGQIVYGVITDIRPAGRTANPAAGSDWKMTIALANGDARSISITFSQVGSKYTLTPEGRVNSWNGTAWEFMPVLKVFDTGLNTRREKRWIVTGNILAGYSQFPGQIISYTKKDGTTGQGVLMSRQFDYEKEKNKAALGLQSADQVLKVLDAVPEITIGTEDGNFKIMRQHGQGYRLMAPSSKREGGTYYLDKDLTDIIGNDFYKRGAMMVAVTYDRDDLGRVIAYMMGQREEPLYALTYKDKARAALGMDEAGETPKYNTQDDYEPTGNAVPDTSAATRGAIEVLQRGLGGPFGLEGGLLGWTNDGIRAVLPIAQAFGVEVVGIKVNVPDPKARRFNGVFYADRVYLNVEATRPHLAVLGHEVGHQMKARRPDLYRRMVEAIEPYIKKGEYEARFRTSAVARGLDADNAREEFIGEVLSDGFMDPAFWQALGNKNKQLLVQVQTFVARILQKLSTLAGYTPRTAEYLTDYAAVMRIAGEVMAEFGLSQDNLLRAAGVPKYNFVGENAADEMFVRDNLVTAEEMERAGADAQTIRMATGWFRAPYDKKWRYELQTDGVKLRDWAALDESKMFQPDITITLDKLLDYPALFQAYPEARDIKVMKRASFMDVFSAVQGWYAEDKNTLAVTPYAQNPLSTILHEVQHWIQAKEGFATGSNPDTAFDTLPLDKKREVLDKVVQSLQGKINAAQQEVDSAKTAMAYSRLPEFVELRTLVKEWENLIKVVPEADDPRRIELYKRMRESQKRAHKAVNYDPTSGWTSTSNPMFDAVTLASNYYGGEIQDRLDKRTKALNELIKLRDSAAAGDEKAVRDAMQRTGDNYALYKAVAGEIEARDVQARMSLTPEQRDNTAPFSSEQYDPKDVQVIYGKGSAPSMSVESPEFKGFFGKSKVTADGKPKRMYHATSRGGFTVFNRLKTLEWRRESMDTVGSWFSDSPSVEGGAGMYATGEGASIYPVYLRIEKPKVYQTFTAFLNDMHKAAGRDPKTQNPPGIGSTTELRNKLKAQGYDGIRFARTDNKGLLEEIKELDDLIREYSRKDPEYAQELSDERKRVAHEYKKTGGSTEFDNQDVWVAFEPEQIVSATGNVGAYRQRPITGEEAARLGMTAEEANKAQALGDIRFQMQDDAEPRLYVDVPSEDWLKGKQDYAKEKGRNRWGVPHMSTITASFRGEPVQVPMSVLTKLKGQRDEQNNVREDSLKWIRANWDEAIQSPPYIEVAYNGEAWVSEGNHRIMVAAEKGLPSLPVEIRYFDGGERANGPLKPEKIAPAAPKFQTQDDDPTASPTGMTERVQRNILQFWGSRDPNLRTMSLYDRTLSTQLNKALKDKHYGKVFALGNAMQNHVSLASIRPAELAPGIVPRVDDFMGAVSTLAKGRTNNKALAGATRALFAGTLAGETVVQGQVWTHDELRSQFGLDDTGIALYTQARAAIDASLDEVAAAEAYALAQADVPKSLRRLIIDRPGAAQSLIDNAMSRNIGMARQALRTAQAANALQERLDELQAEIDRRIQSKARVDAVFSRARQLKAAGYAPLMRFGKFTVTVYAIDPQTGNRLRDANGDTVVSYFRMHETQAEANADRRRVEAMIGEDDAYEVATGTRSELKHELYQGISPETLALFAEEVGADAALKKFYEVALTERSALKRRLERKNTRGFDEDLPRVLATFITSNGRFASQRFFLREFNNAVKFIPKEKGDVVDEAIKLRRFMMDPTDTGANMSGLMFAWFLGGSVASAMVNLSQPLTMTAPYLSQFSTEKLSAKKAIAQAIPQAMGAKEITDRDLRAAIKRASLEGVVDAQEVFHLYSQASRGISSKLANALARIPGAAQRLRQGGESARARAEAFFTLWGMMFAKAEGFNRRLTFIAAWNMAIARAETNPYAFAVRAVNETQGIFNKINRPNWARSNVGRTVLTFKQYSLMYLELVRRMWKSGPEGKRAVFFMLAVLMLLSGEEGLPFAQDLDDLIDTIGQLMGYDTNMKRNKRRLAYEILGKHGGDLFLYGISSKLPLDFAGRLGLGNLIPGTGMFKVSGAENQAREVAEVVGPVGSLGVSLMDAYEAASVGNWGKAAENMSPKAVKDLRAGADMAVTGTAKDTRGRKNMDVDLVDAASKSIGFQPTKLAEATRARSPIMQDRALQKKKEEAIVDQWARGLATNDEKMVTEAKAEQAKWNAKNPNTPVYITPEQLRQAAKSYRQDQDSRIRKSMPRELRERAGLDLAK